MTQWVTIASHHDFWRILRELGHDDVEPVDQLRIESGLTLLRGVGLQPTWPSGQVIVERLIQDSRPLIGGARKVARQLGTKPDSMNKIFQGHHLPTLDVACRWATRLVHHAQSRGLAPPDVLLRVSIPPLQDPGSALDPRASPHRSASAPIVGAIVGEIVDSARAVGESVGGTQPSVGASVGGTRPSVGESVGQMRPAVGAGVGGSVGEDLHPAQFVGESVGQIDDSAHQDSSHQEIDVSRLTPAAIAEHPSLVLTTIEWRHANGRRMQLDCAPHEARALIEKYYDEWAGAQILLNGKPFDDSQFFLERSIRALEARLERKLEVMLAAQPQAQGGPQAKTELQSALDEVLAPLRDDLIGLRQRMEAPPRPALRMFASAILEMMEEDDDG